jgi:protein-tyrosine-phosphatase
MAEGLARALFGARATVQSAGTRPTEVHPLLPGVMAETHIDITSQRAKPIEEIELTAIDIVITLCHEKVCPDSLSGKQRYHWPIDDPLKGKDRLNEETLKTRLRSSREGLRVKLRDNDAKLTWVAPASYLNWRAHLDERPITSRSEVPVYSDALRLTGSLEIGLGPYRLQNALPYDERDPALIMSVDGYLSSGDTPRMDRTNTDGFTGSWLADEIAALSSLEVGVRLMAGAPTRFRSTDDHWTVTGDQDRPTFFPSRRSRRAILPRLSERKTLTAELLSTLPNMTSDEARSLVRAARSYRDALWIVESEPELAWLLLVSALEVAALQLQVQKSPVEILREEKPRLVALLGDDKLESVAEEFDRELGATARFKALARRFLPEPPDRRPPEAYQLNWDPAEMERRFGKVYKLRSNSLHEGIPFPPPMCDPPAELAEDIWSETVVGLATSSTGGVWAKADLPFSLHMFEYMTRGILLKWWRALANLPTTQPASDRPADLRR